MSVALAGTSSPDLPSEATFEPWGPAQAALLRDRLRAGKVWDLVVVGAGITGAGVARDAAMRGLDVLVLDAADLAYGTSSRSTRLIHGGVRYLEQGQIGLVYEALRERARLYRSAAHLVAPARFLFPAYRGDRLGPWKLRLGLTLYDTLNFFRGSTHVSAGPERCAELEPLLRREELRGAVLYEDAVTDDARLTLTVLQGARRHGAEVLTYASASKIERNDVGVSITLDTHEVISAREVVVATGPWTGRKLLGDAGRGVLTKSKGIHLVMRAEHVPVQRPVVVQAPGDQRRILFVVPWGSRTYLGTTDVPYEGDPAHCGVSEAEEEELLGIIRHVMPGAALSPQNIISAWSGVRPLVRPEGTEDSDTAEVSRKHRLVYADSGAIGLVGGKLTTFRAMAEEAVDVVVGRLRSRWPAERSALRPCSTHRVPLVPGAPLRADELDDPLLADLRARHGPLARVLAAQARAQPGDDERIVADLPYRRIEISHAIEFEGATHVTDVLRRRLPLALTDADLGGTIAAYAARRLIDARGGGQQDIDDELERYREEVRVETRRIPTLSV